jgi:hypothetical protein
MQKCFIQNIQFSDFKYNNLHLQIHLQDYSHQLYNYNKLFP